MEDTIKAQAVMTRTIHRAAMVKCATDAISLGHYIGTLIAKDLGLEPPALPQRGRPKSG
jgi:hypothetical protein